LFPYTTLFRSQRGDSVPVADEYAIGAPHLARLRRDVEAAGGAHEGQSGLGTGAGDLQGRGPSGLCERSVGEERAPPRGLAVRDSPVHDGRGQTADRTPARVEETRLPRERGTVCGHADEVPAAAPQ